MSHVRDVSSTRIRRADQKEYIFTAIRKYNTTELCGIVKRYEETYKIILKTIKKIE